MPVPGYDIRVLADDGEEVAADTIGAIVVKLPLPPGNLPTLWNADERFVTSYLETFPGHYLTSDAGFKDADVALLVGARPFVSAPSTDLEVVARPEQLEEPLRDSLVDVEEGSQGGIESFDGAARPVALLKYHVHNSEKAVSLF